MASHFYSIFSTSCFVYPPKSIFKMIENNNLTALKEALQHCAELKSFSQNKIVLEESAWHAAARMNRVDCLKILLAECPSAPKQLEKIAVYFDSEHPQFLTPLQVAIYKKNSESEKVLMNYFLNQGNEITPFPDFTGTRDE